jgi:hypothetical protein
MGSSVHAVPAKKTSMLAASLPSAVPLRHLLRLAATGRRLFAPQGAHDYVRAPDNLAFAPTPRARRMMRAARHGAA